MPWAIKRTLINQCWSSVGSIRNETIFKSCILSISLMSVSHLQPVFMINQALFRDFSSVVKGAHESEVVWRKIRVMGSRTSKDAISSITSPLHHNFFFGFIEGVMRVAPLIWYDRLPNHQCRFVLDFSL